MTNRIDADVDPVTNEETDRRTREQIEQQEADAVIDRHQDVAGRRESAGQPGGDEEPAGNQGRNLQQMNAAQSGDDVHQQTQQQQPQTPSGSQDAAIDRKEG